MDIQPQTQSRFIVHRHKSRRSHFDLRMMEDRIWRSWSLLKEPPARGGEQRLAIERESFQMQDMDSRCFNEEAFGPGLVSTWDEGEVCISHVSSCHLQLRFNGRRMTGRYELKRMRWFPGNRWLLKKVASSRVPGKGS